MAHTIVTGQTTGQSTPVGPVQQNYTGLKLYAHEFYTSLISCTLNSYLSISLPSGLAKCARLRDKSSLTDGRRRTNISHDRPTTQTTAHTSADYFRTRSMYDLESFFLPILFPGHVPLSARETIRESVAVRSSVSLCPFVLRLPSCPPASVSTCNSTAAVRWLICG